MHSSEQIKQKVREKFKKFCDKKYIKFCDNDKCKYIKYRDSEIEG